MATKRDYYEVLGVSKSADETTIRKAYREIAKKYHPDVKPDDKEAEAIFKEATEAYAVLSDADKRKQYDQMGHAAFDGGMGGAGAGGFNFDFNDISSMFGGSGGFGDIFSELFGGGRRNSNPNAPRKGADVQTSIKISFTESAFGCDKSIDIPFKETCASCNGTGAKKGTTSVRCSKCGGKGQVVYTQQTIFGATQSVRVCPDCGGRGEIIKEKCPDCSGKGYKKIKKTISISIPAGIANGECLKLSGRGEPGEKGGPRGDLILQVLVAKDSKFQREDYDLFSTETISFTKAALGGDINIKTIDGDYTHNLKAGTQTDTTIKLSNKGITRLHYGGGRGDHYVKLVVDVPKSLTAKQRELVEQLSKAFDEEPVKKRKLF